MIDIQVRVHDNFSLEFKTGLITSSKPEDINDFRINTWLFIPNSLDINRETYSKSDFYKDIKNNLRLITPIYTLEEVLKQGKGPLPRLQKSLEALILTPKNEVATESFSYQIKMFVCIMKSALRRHVQLIDDSSDDSKIITTVDSYISNTKEIALRYRELWKGLMRSEITKEQRNFYYFGDDFLGNIIEQYAFALIHKLGGNPTFENIKPKLIELIDSEITYRKERGFMLLDKTDEKHNSLVISQRGILKKFVESDLFLQTVRKKDGFLAEQFYYSIAAGVAMVFATVISFFATQQFGNFTTDLFIILVFSYMFKDRIKDIMRYYFSSKLGKRYYDSKLNLSIRKQEIGWIREGVDYMEEEKLPAEVRNIRARGPLTEAENQVYDEKILLYRKWIKLSKDDIEKYKEYRLSGINDILKLNLLHFTQKMDNPYIPLYMQDRGNDLLCIRGNKMYSLYVIIQCKSDEKEFYKKYRILFNREGISDVSELN